MEIDPSRLAETCRREGIALLVLFGSRAAGTARPDSDFDLAAQFDRPPEELYDVAAAQGRLAQALDVPDERLDLVVLNTASSTTLRHQIAKGRCLYDRDGERWGEFWFLALMQYEDWKPYRRIFWHARFGSSR